MQWPGKEKLLGAGMSDYLAKPIEEERLHNCCCATSWQRYFLSRRDARSQRNCGEPECDPRLATGTTPCSRKTDLARDMLQMLLDFLPEVRNKVEEQLVGENRKAG